MSRGGAPVLTWRRTDLAQDFLLKLARAIMLSRQYRPNAMKIAGTRKNPTSKSARKKLSSPSLSEMLCRPREKQL